MRFLFLFFVFFSLFVYAKNKEYTQFGDIKVTWSAYKTPLKEAVNGTFTQMVYAPVATNAKSLSSLFKGSYIEINNLSVNTGNKLRDKALSDAFFGNISATIRADIISLVSDEKNQEHGIIEIKLSLNDITKIIPLQYHYRENVFEAYGTIDIFDFDGYHALSSINEACHVQHEGKIWNDIDIHFSTIVSYTPQ